MSAPFSNEDAEVRVGVIVRPLRGHWRPVGSQPQIHLDDIRNTLDPSVWKTAHDFDNEAKMLFTSKMVYSNHKLNEGDGAAAEVEVQKHSHPPMAPISKIKDREKSSADSVLVSRCPSSCKCGASSTAVTLNSPPPESNRIKVPPNLDEEKDLWKEIDARSAGKNKTSPTTHVWVAKSKSKSRRSTKEETDETASSGSSVSGSAGSSLTKGTSKKSDSSEEIRVTTSPLPKQQKLQRKAPDKPSKSDKGRAGVPEKPSPLKDDQKMKPGATQDKTSKESERLRVKFDLQDSSKTSVKKNAPSLGRDSRPTSPRRISSTSSGTETPEVRGQDTPRKENRPIRAKLTTLSRSRLKTVTYKEEPFMSEFKSWVLLIIFLSMIWLYRSTLFS